MLIGGVNNSQQAGQGIATLVDQINKNAAEQANVNVAEDVVELSLEGRQKAKEEQGSQADLEMLIAQMENAKAQGDAMGSMMDERIKCLRIAMNIMSGDKVPVEDIRFLAEKDPEMFARSMSLRKHKADPDECERVTEDEKDKSSESYDSGINAIGGGGSNTAPIEMEAAAPAAPAESVGGEVTVE